MCGDTEGIEIDDVDEDKDGVKHRRVVNMKSIETVKRRSSESRVARTSRMLLSKVPKELARIRVSTKRGVRKQGRGKGKRRKYTGEGVSHETAEEHDEEERPWSTKKDVRLRSTMKTIWKRRSDKKEHVKRGRVKSTTKVGGDKVQYTGQAEIRAAGSVRKIHHHYST